MYVVTGMSEEIDAYYRARELGDPDAKPPDFKTPEVLRRFIRRMEAVRPRHFISATLLLLQFGSDTRDQIAQSLPGAEAYFQKNGVARWMIFRTDPMVGYGLILACAQVGSPRMNQSVAKGCALKAQQGMSKAILVLWRPPFESGDFAIQFI
jgi:hypothetical protein